MVAVVACLVHGNDQWVFSFEERARARVEADHDTIKCCGCGADTIRSLKVDVGEFWLLVELVLGTPRTTFTTSNPLFEANGATSNADVDLVFAVLLKLAKQSSELLNVMSDVSPSFHSEAEKPLIRYIGLLEYTHHGQDGPTKVLFGVVEDAK